MSRAYFLKLFMSPLIYVSILGIAAVCATNFLNGWICTGSVVYHMNIFLDLDAYRKIIAVLGALPFAGNFADEWNEAVALHCIVRRGVGRYSLANIMFCFMVSLLSVFLGMMLFSGIYSLFIPFYEFDPNPKFTPYGVFLDEGHPFLYLAARVFVFAASCAMWSVMGMLLSAFFPNKYIAICSPFVASYVIERITIQFPDLLNLHVLSLSYLDKRYSPAFGLSYSLGIFIGVSAVCGLVFYTVVRRRTQCEIV